MPTRAIEVAPDVRRGRQRGVEFKERAIVRFSRGAPEGARHFAARDRQPGDGARFDKAAPGAVLVPIEIEAQPLSAVAEKTGAPRRLAPGKQHRAGHQRRTDGGAGDAVDAAPAALANPPVDPRSHEVVEIALHRLFRDQLRADHRFVMFEQDDPGQPALQVHTADDVEGLAAIACGGGEVPGGKQVAGDGAAAERFGDGRRALYGAHGLGLGKRPGDHGRREAFGERIVHRRAGRRCDGGERSRRRRKGGERARENDCGPGHLREASAKRTRGGAAARGRPISRMSFSIIAAAKSS